MNHRILVCPVAYNERVKIKNVVERFLKSRAFGKTDYCVVDDGSDDGTSEVIAGYGPQGVRTVRHPGRSGVGAAIRTAIRYAQNHQYDVLVIMSGNDKDDPEEIPSVAGPVVEQGFDLVQGSRYLGKAGCGGGMPFYRKGAPRFHPV